MLWSGMSKIDQRAVLERLIRDRGEGYAGISRLIGRNAAYIQQFIKRGVPGQLDEKDRRLLARYFGISDAELGGRDTLSAGDDDLVRVPRLAVGASAGHGAWNDADRQVGSIGFSPALLRRVGASGSSDLSFITVQGDSMLPTLSDGDDILVNQADAADRLRDGIYVLRRDDTLMVKRVAMNPMAGSVTIKSDNPAYPEWRDCDLSTLRIIGRVIWAGHKIN